MKFSVILNKPAVTEKAIDEAKRGVYTLDVHIKATKDQIINAIEQLYKVKVQDVKTLIRKGKVAHVGRKRSKKQRPDRKIAYITLKKGTLDIIPIK